MTDVGGMFQIAHYNHGGPARAAVVFHHQDVTMVRTLKICFVDPDPIRTQAFLRAHLRGGLWYLLAREYYPTGFIGVRIFGSREIPGMFVLIEIWTSTESLEAARRTPAVFVLERFQRNLTISTLDCGAFQVSTSTSERPGRPGGVCAGGHRCPDHRTMHASAGIRYCGARRFRTSLAHPCATRTNGGFL